MRPYFSRLQEIHRIRGKLERDGFPRLQMSLLVTITGAAGFLASYSLLHAGMSEMWVRYLVALGITYLVFLLLLWMWLRTSAKDYADFPDLSNFVPGHGNSSGASYGGKGGEFGGGGASGSFDQPIEPMHLESVSLSSDTNPVGEALGAVSDADELAIPLAILVLVVALLLSSFFVIYSAPILFAELLVDGVLAASLYRRLRGLETRHWLETAIRRTFWPFLLTALFVAAAGWAMGFYAPGAESIGDVLLHAKKVL
ncbi:MAG: hypothetical protein ACYCZJ_09325 [Sulfuriferula sp.]